MIDQTSNRTNKLKELKDAEAAAEMALAMLGGFREHCGENFTDLELRIGLNSGPVVAILTRYQGHLVKYLHEVGLKKCIIEPVYSNDIEKTFLGSCFTNMDI